MTVVVPPVVLDEIRLRSFKSVRDAILPVRDLTLLVGRNGSGKSNVLDGIWVLSRLAAGGEIRDQLDGGRDGPAVRGGVEGCAPLGSDRFELGCTVGTGDARYHLDVTVRVRPVVQVVHERLWLEPRSKGAKPRTLLESEPPDPGSADITARVSHRGRASGSPVTFRASRLLTSQASTRVSSTTQAGREVIEAAEIVLRALAGILVLDPVPRSMRQYVPVGDDRLRRHADNLSAVLGRLLGHPGAHERLLGVARSLSESRIASIATEQSSLGDVMLVQREILGGQEATVPARLMSDGTLRVLAILAALLEGSGERNPSGSLVDATPTTLVLDEIENGLHPSQASAMVMLVLEESRARRIRTLATTHSPAMLDALPGAEHDGVVICVRDDEGWTRLHPLTDLPNYFGVVAGGTLGGAATGDRLRPVAGGRPASELLDELFGDR